MLNSAVSNFAWKSQILRFIYYKLVMYSSEQYNKNLLRTGIGCAHTTEAETVIFSKVLLILMILKVKIRVQSI